MLMEMVELMIFNNSFVREFKFKVFHGFLTSYCYHQSSIKDTFENSSLNKIKLKQSLKINS